MHCKKSSWAAAVSFRTGQRTKPFLHQSYPVYESASAEEALDPGQQPHVLDRRDTFEPLRSELDYSWAQNNLLDRVERKISHTKSPIWIVSVKKEKKKRILNNIFYKTVKTD